MTLLLVSGPSTIGKSTVWSSAAARIGFRLFCPYTTRVRRIGEQDGDDYHFISIQDFQDLIRTKQLIEWDYFNGAYYGSDIAIFEQEKKENVCLQILGRMGLRVKRTIPVAITVMLLPTSEAILVDRMRKRGYTGRDFDIRFLHYKEEELHAPLFDHVVPSAEVITEFEAVQILTDVVAKAEASII